MKKIFLFVAAMVFALAANAAVINIDNTTADALRTALNSAADGDEIVMAAGTYVESNSNFIAFDGKAVTVKAAEGAEVIIQPQVPITVSNGGHAIFENVKIDASRLTELADWYEHLLYVTDDQPNGCTFRGSELYGFNLNKSMFYCNGTNKVAVMKFENCYLHDIMKSIIFIENTAGKPMVSVKNCTFENISTNTESYWAGVIDVRAEEATLQVDHCTFYNVIPMNTDYSCVSKITLAKGTVSNCIFMLPTAQDGIRAMRGVSATNCITFNYLKDSGTGIHSSVTQTNCVQADPLFVDAANGNFTLGEGSPALTMNDGEPIGDPRWVPSVAPVEPLMKTIYCKMDKDWWKADGAAVGIYAWGDNNAQLAAWPGVRMAPVEGETDIWSIELDINTYHMCIFTRVNGEGDVADWGAKTGDLTIPTDENDMFTITNDDPTWGDPGCTGAWSVYGAEPQPVVAEWAEIVWTEAVEAADLAEDATFTVEGSEFSAQITDPDNKMAIDANTARFGTVEAFTDYTHRLKTGGKTNNGKNFITLNIPAAGQLRIAVRTGSNSATDRNLVIVQGEDTLYNQVVKEDDKTVVPGEGGDTNYYPYVIVPVQAGSVVLTYPVNGLNFYAFGFKAGETPQPQPELPYVALIGEMNNWDDSAANQLVPAEDGLTASLTVNIELNDNNGYGFKILVGEIGLSAHGNEGWYGLGRDAAPVKLDWAEANSDPIWLAMDIAGEYTFTYTYADSTLVVAFPALAPVEHTYTVAGDNATIFGTTWDVTNTANDMELQEDNTYKWEKENLELPVGNIEFKVAQDHSWSVNYPNDNYVLAIAESGSYTITITFNAETKEVAAVATKTGDADVTPSVAMHGDFTKDGWKDTENFTIAEDKASASLTLTLAADRYEFGMRIGGAGNWTANGAQFSRENPSAEVVAGSGNLVLTTDVDGDYTFTWTYETNTLTITFPANEEGISNTVVDVKAVKTIENGQLVIIKNGVKYNVQGAQF